MSANTPEIDAKKMVLDLKTIWQKPKATVLNHCLKSTVYSVGIKALSMVAFYFSQVASGLILGFSVFMIDRIIVQNFERYRKKFVRELYNNDTFKSLLGIQGADDGGGNISGED